MIVNGGLKKSATPEPSRRNSGHIAVPIVIPSAASRGRTISSTVPGGTVDRTTTVWKSARFGSDATLLAIISVHRWTKLRSVLPFADDGVPTQMSETSAPLSASAGSVDA